MENTTYTLIKDMKPGMKNINVVFIVLDVGPPTITKDNREVRTFKVADSTACINVSIWDDPGQLLMPGDIVKLTKGYASVWRSCLTLYSGKNGDIQKVGEFCMVINETVNMSEPNAGLAQQLVGQGPSGTTGNNNNNNAANPNNGPASTPSNAPVPTTSAPTSNPAPTGKNSNGGGSTGSSQAPSTAQSSASTASSSSLSSSSSTAASSAPSTGKSSTGKSGSRGRGNYSRNGRASERR